MRRSIYNDYRPLRIVLLLLLVVLGLVAYFTCGKASSEHVHTGGKDYVVTKEATCTEEGLKHMVCTECGVAFGHTSIPVLAHKPSQSVDENVVKPTCTEGGTHDTVVYCKDCGYEISRVEVADKALGHKPGTATKENNVDPTHVNDGGYDTVTRCVTCKETLTTVANVVEAIGHNYTAWEVKYDEDATDFVAYGKCSCDEEGNVITLSGSDVLTATYNEKYAPCCKNEYSVKLYYTYKYNGKTVLVNKTFTVELPVESHKILVDKVKDEATGEVTFGFIKFDDIACYDKYGRYYDLANEMVAEHISIDSNAEWDEYGFTYDAYFICGHCSEMNCGMCSNEITWIQVRLYSAEHDQTKD